MDLEVIVAVSDLVELTPIVSVFCAYKTFPEYREKSRIHRAVVLYLIYVLVLFFNSVRNSTKFWELLNHSAQFWNNAECNSLNAKKPK